MRVKTDEHTVDVRSNQVEYISNKHDINLKLLTKNRYELRITYKDKVISQNIMTFNINSKHSTTYAHLNHLFIPDTIRGYGIGKLCLSIFYSLLKLENINKFSMKFGGGKNSARFLRRIGFSNRYIETATKEDLQDDSVFVGDFKSFGSHKQWNLDPIPISNFPTKFFN